MKIYATDVDEEALGAARQATYAAKAVEGVPAALLERYFVPADQRWAFRKELRRSVIFGRNDLVRDAPISRIDLLTCRNTLMYFNAETQARILRRLNFALNDRGFLFLGKSEMLITRSELFRPVDLKRRVFQKVVRTATLRERLLQAAHGNGAETAADAGEALRDEVFDASPVAQVAVDADGLVVMVNQQARDFFHLSAADLGRPLKDLELSYRPVDLRSSLDVAFAERRPVVMPGATATVAGGDIARAAAMEQAATAARAAAAASGRGRARAARAARAAARARGGGGGGGGAGGGGGGGGGGEQARTD